MNTLTALKFALLAALALTATARAEEKIIFSTDSGTELSSAPLQGSQPAVAESLPRFRAQARPATPPAAELQPAAARREPAAAIPAAAPTAETPAQVSGTGKGPADTELSAGEAGRPAGTETAAAALREATKPRGKPAYFEPRSLINY